MSAAAHLLALLAVFLTAYWWRNQLAFWLVALLLVVALLSVLLSWWVVWRRSAGAFSRLIVDQHGGLVAQRRSDGVALMLSPAASRRVGPFVALDVASAKSCSHRILIARDHCTADQWRRLQVWLNWLGRSPNPQRR